MFRYAAAILLVLLAGRPAAGQQPAPAPPDFDPLIARLEHVVGSGDAAQYLALLAPGADTAAASDFADAQLAPGTTRAVVRLRDAAVVRDVYPPGVYRLVVELFAEYGQRARIATWRLDVRARAPDARNATGWHIVGQEQLSLVDGLYQLVLDESRQFAARKVVISAEDFTMTLEHGSIFLARIDQGVTALVLVGRGNMRFSPAPPAERGQVKIFSGEETLEAEFSRALVRLNPFQFDERVRGTMVARRRVDPRDLGRARETFAEFVDQSYTLELSELSPDPWSLVPNVGDFVAEIVTRRHGTLTYARALSEAEDVTLFDRKRKRNIALYASPQKLARRGLYYDESDLVDYDVLNYAIDVAFQPAREWIEGRARLTLRMRAAASTLTLKLAAALAVREVRSDRYGRLLHLRVRGQDNLLIGLPAMLASDAEDTIEVVYSGALPPQPLDREALVLRPSGLGQELPFLAPEPRYIYSNRSFWYPQASVSDYASARLRLTVPAEYEAIATGQLAPGSPALVEQDDGTRVRQYLFVVRQPARYLSWVVSRFQYTPARPIAVGGAGGGIDGNGSSRPNQAVSGVVYDTVQLAVAASPRRVAQAPALADRAADIIRFYTSMLGDYPYPTFTVAWTESDAPGGHSPAYFAILNHPVPARPFFWRRDPVSFEGFDAFFLAHELAHQWWGQAVGWKNYHEQWLSEGFAQYFAALYAQHQRGDGQFTDILRQMRRTSIEHASQGPIYLGYRLGHIRQEGRVFRALIYNKAAMVLHMLRRLVGDEAFFAGLRGYYAEWRFRKAGTADLQRAIEQEAGRPLDRFFQQWIHEAGIPRLRFSHRIERGASRLTDGDQDGAEAEYVRLRFEQRGEPFELPVTVALTYRSGDSQEVVVRVAEQVSELRVPLLGELRRVAVNPDHAALAEIRR